MVFTDRNPFWPLQNPSSSVGSLSRGARINEVPSPDMLKGIKVAYVLENNLDPQLAFNEGVTLQEFETIKRMHELSKWRRENPHEYPNPSCGL